MYMYIVMFTIQVISKTIEKNKRKRCNKENTKQDKNK